MNRDLALISSKAGHLLTVRLSLLRSRLSRRGSFYARQINVKLYGASDYVELVQRRGRREVWVHIAGMIYIEPMPANCAFTIFADAAHQFHSMK